MSIMSYLNAGKYNSSAPLRERLLIDALRARIGRPVDLGIAAERPGYQGTCVDPASDPVLRFHCRVAEKPEE